MFASWRDCAFPANRFLEKLQRAVFCLPFADNPTLFGCPPVIYKRDYRRLEIGSVIRASLSRLGELHLEGDIGAGLLDALQQHHGIELPFPGFGAVAVGFVVPGVVNLYLPDGTLCECLSPI